MKKILISILATVLALAPALAANTTKSYQLSGFTGIRASNAFTVELTQSQSFSVSVDVPDYLEQYLRVTVEQNQLVIGLTTLPKAVERKLSAERRGVLSAVVRMPSLERVSLSGAAILECSGVFPALMDRAMRIDMSGTSHVNGLEVSGRSIDISLSGASGLDLTGSFNNMDVDISGASTVWAKADIDELDAELSGSGRLEFEGGVEEASIEASGAAHASLRSSITLRKLEIEGSGATSIDTRNAAAETVEVELSGAANCKVSAIRRIEVEASGASTCLYESGPDTRVNVIQVSRGATLRKL